MPIPARIQTLIIQLRQELSQIEQKVTQGLETARMLLFLFPDNMILIQFFSLLSNSLFLAENYRQRLDETENILLLDDIQQEIVDSAAEELSTMLGTVLEAKIRVENIIRRMKDLS